MKFGRRVLLKLGMAHIGAIGLVFCILFAVAPRVDASDFGYPTIGESFYAQSDAYGACVAFAAFETSFYNGVGYPGYYECRAVNSTSYAAWINRPAFNGNPPVTGWAYPNCCGFNQLFTWISAPQSGFAPPKNLGSPHCSCADPIEVSTGNRYEEATDVAIDSGITFRRYYNSLSKQTRGWHLGSNWTHSYSRYLDLSGAALPSFVAISGGAQSPQSLLFVNVIRDDGRQFAFTSTYNGGTALSWTSDTDIHDQLTELYSSSGAVSGWRYFDATNHVTEIYSTSGNLLSATDATGKVTTFTYVNVPGLVANTTDTVLASITSPTGRVITLTYASSGALASLGLPDGSQVVYQQDTSLNLASVTYPDGKLLQYVYNEHANILDGTNDPNLMTGVIDESGVRFATFTYESIYSPYHTSNAGGANYYTSSLSLTAPTNTFVTPLNASRVFNWTTINSRSFVTSIVDSCSGCTTATTSYAYDANGNTTQMTDPLGNVTNYTYASDGSGLEIERVEAVGTTVQRTIQTTWDESFRLPLLRTVSDASGNVTSNTQWIYNAAGQTLAQCNVDPVLAGTYTCSNTGATPAGVRRWTYTYCAAVDTTQCPVMGLLLTVNGPRTDLIQTTTYGYYLTDGSTAQHGDLQLVTDALGHTTTYLSYDGAGRVLSQQDANGIITGFTYTPRGQLASRSVGGATTNITYTPYGAVASVTDPDGVMVSYTYDGAHRLTKITDALGNYIQYTLDAAGNKTAEKVYDSGGTLHKSLSRTYNALGQLTQVIDGLSHAVFNAGYSDSYDANGNLVHTADALGIQRKQGYDGLNRLVQTLDNYNGTDTATQNTQSVFAYDANDRLEGVGDPDGLNTTYTYDGLGNATAVVSPDTGTTTTGYDAAGNATQRTDAKSVVSNSTYDALNRRTATSYADTTLNVAYGYDEPNSTTGCASSYPVGRLTRVIELNVTTVYCYDQRGNVTQKSQTQGTATDVTLYGYTPADRLTSTVTAAGTSIQYSRDAAGRISGVTALPPGTNGAGAGNVVTAISYLPFGPIASYTLGNGQTITRSYDANYALTDVVSPALNLHFQRDAIGNIAALGNAPGANPATETYTYDPLYRLTGLYNASGTAEEAYTYSKTGDRLSKTATGLDSGTYSYQSGTHHLASIGNASRVYDANGNTTGSVVGGNTYGFGYNGRNRMTVAQLNGGTVGTYTYNALGQRTAKVATVSQRFVYDENSQLLSEYGGTSRDYIWLDDLPVATVDTTGTTSTVSYVHADGLNTPRAVSDSSENTIWQLAYQGNPFGEQQPTSASGFVYNFRFAGQYYDNESGLANNINRDQEAALGRYIQPDPLGQTAGPSLYAYVHSDPLNRIDPDGQLDSSGPLGQALKRAAVVDAAGGGPEDLAGDVVAVGVLGYSLADQIARGANQQEVHSICDEPPPPNLNDCDLAKWKLTKALRCKLVRQRMADKWFGGTFDAGHATRMSQLENEIARLRGEVDRKCKPCP